MEKPLNGTRFRKVQQRRVNLSKRSQSLSHSATISTATGEQARWWKRIRTSAAVEVSTLDRWPFRRFWCFNLKIQQQSVCDLGSSDKITGCSVFRDPLFSFPGKAYNSTSML
ncbi:hypothetical protein Nepgr_001688 [Nepenthes gracilis]|uniref:Uncharacterized protein n=1 Tax=Nepenthes gracilis TaxID=150966 RepID=A0AAD3P4W4_NEPGR|nr:hypothetical protein Nepgr_001688 [Nepenthes gracilis]